MNSVNLNLSYDLSKHMSEFERQFEQRTREAVRSIISDHFCDGRYGSRKGSGFMEIEEYLDKLFGTEEFQGKMNKIFQDNFEVILREAMMKAIQHKVNKMVFTSRDERMEAMGATAALASITADLSIPHVQ